MENNNEVTEYLKTFIPLVDFIASILGPQSEVVLNDVTNLDHSVLYIRNSSITNRKVGDPASNFVLKFMKDGIDENTNFLANYTGKSKSFPNLRSSTYFIRYHKQVVGMLCVNTDEAIIDDLFKQFELFKQRFKIPASPIIVENSPSTLNGLQSENFNETVATLSAKAVKKKEDEVGFPVQRFKQADKIDVVRSLYEDGYFFLKESVQTVADCLHVSIPTIYRYLNKVKVKDA